MTSPHDPTQTATAQSDRYRTAWKSARGRSIDYSAALDHVVSVAERSSEDLARMAHDQLTRAETAEATIARVRAFAEDMATWCSPHGVAASYAQRLLALLDNPPSPGN